MKFYNPFKPHIVKEAERYFIRKLTVWGWAWGGDQPLGYSTFWTRSEVYKQVYCCYYSVENASLALREIEETLKNNKTEVIL